MPESGNLGARGGRKRTVIGGLARPWLATATIPREIGGEIRVDTFDNRDPKRFGSRVHRESSRRNELGGMYRAPNEYARYQRRWMRARGPSSADPRARPVDRGSARRNAGMAALPNPSRLRAPLHSAK